MRRVGLVVAGIDGDLARHAAGLHGHDGALGEVGPLLLHGQVADRGAGAVRHADDLRVGVLSRQDGAGLPADGQARGVADVEVDATGGLQVVAALGHEDDCTGPTADAFGDGPAQRRAIVGAAVAAGTAVPHVHLEGLRGRQRATGRDQDEQGDDDGGWAHGRIPVDGQCGMARMVRVATMAAPVPAMGSRGAPWSPACIPATARAVRVNVRKEAGQRIGIL